MPKRTDINSILIIGAGPIIIGQACEFDYSGTQACKALREEGYRVILVNSNPATIMTDPDLADATYVEPITPEMVEKIIEKERPDAILPTMGGQTGLNTALELDKNGVLEKYNVELIGAKVDAINKAEDRQLFKDAMNKLKINMPRSRVVNSIEEAMEALDFIKLPSIIRPSFTMGGTGGGIAYNKEEYEQIVKGGLDASPTTEVLVEQSIVGWKEYEMEVVRDTADNCIIICSIENFDPMGIHTGDSITVAPALTLTDKEYQIMRNASIAVLREIGVETGGSNVQFAVNPADGELIIIEMNPRVSRSSALASKATGFPIAKVAAKLAVGYTLDELSNEITGVTPSSFEPTIDYVVTKIPRFTFEKFPGAKPTLTTAMKSVGEAMSIGRSFPESLQKALRSMETDLTGLNEIPVPGYDPEIGDINAVRAALAEPTSDRILILAQALRLGMSTEEIHSIAKYDPWFIEQLRLIIDAEQQVRENGIPSDKLELIKLKELGFADERLAELAGLDVKDVMDKRYALGVKPSFKRIDTCAAEFESGTPYLYSSYERDAAGVSECEAEPTDAKKIVILGGGPNRIGQGIEFDYCCCHAAFALSDQNYETIMVNCNPETVSTDYDTSDRLYFEPLTAENVIDLIRREQENGEVVGVIVQFGGQTPLKLSHALEAAGIPILGTSPDSIDLAEDRERFQDLVNRLELKQPENGLATTTEQAVEIAEGIGYPILIRPSYVLGGRAMEIVYDTVSLKRYMKEAVSVSWESPVLIDKYLGGATEIDVDALCDGEEVHVAAVMQHIEEAGVHSGDSACSLPPYSLKDSVLEDLEEQTKKLALALNVRGLMNVQFAVKDDVVYLIEVNPRASRTVPFVAKAIGAPVAKIAARLMAGEKIKDFDIPSYRTGHVAVKEAVLPFNRFPDVDILLGPEMRSTGEVIGLDEDFPRAFLKSQIAANTHLPLEGKVFISVKNRDKAKMVQPAKELLEMGYTVVATGGTAEYLQENGVEVERINKVLEGRPHIVDAIKNDEIDLIFNTTEGAQSIQDSYTLRRSALVGSVPYYTTSRGAISAMEAIKVLKSSSLEVKPLQSY
ncbi:carbamoyl-phosphate synthase large subunit [Pseudemcibacter aquimaris]|uniref:carbamoyl-phosphate synthase large subunit n=1 Tax=Pseudemcibacter aquimaris TaxID=2857064 RepID=UPI002012C922|nr:carbamoyl-phosphate synthase large subunit [Pseudemcibacter aquimaris]MCC3861450.1 carbamoyl-phosphate synthase large subunit [Pseudemcibacter aquimaris]WDU58219.1 carbamoyl-phosphate synthase large subunit [Pseudemcibacter aquimaris]